MRPLIATFALHIVCRLIFRDSCIVFYNVFVRLTCLLFFTEINVCSEKYSCNNPMGGNVTMLHYNFCYCKHGLEQESRDTCRAMKKITTYGKTTIEPTTIKPQPKEPGI